MAVALAQSTSISVTVACGSVWNGGGGFSQCRCVRVFSRQLFSSQVAAWWRRQSDGDFGSESALVVDLIRSGSATRGFVNVWWFVVAALFRETSAGSGFVAVEVARNTDLVVFA